MWDELTLLSHKTFYILFLSPAYLKIFNLQIYMQCELNCELINIKHFIIASKSTRIKIHIKTISINICMTYFDFITHHLLKQGCAIIFLGRRCRPILRLSTVCLSKRHSLRLRPIVALLYIGVALSSA